MVNGLSLLMIMYVHTKHGWPTFAIHVQCNYDLRLISLWFISTCLRQSDNCVSRDLINGGHNHSIVQCTCGCNWGLLRFPPPHHHHHHLTDPLHPTPPPKWFVLWPTYCILVTCSCSCRNSRPSKPGTIFVGCTEHIVIRNVQSERELATN